MPRIAEVHRVYFRGVYDHALACRRRTPAAGSGAAAGIFGMSEAGKALGLPAVLGIWLVTTMVATIRVVVFLYFGKID